MVKVLEEIRVGKERRLSRDRLHERRSEDLKKWLVVSNRAAIESKDHNLIIQV